MEQEDNSNTNHENVIHSIGNNLENTKNIDKKKMKKWLKKVEKGDVHTVANYLICRYSYNLLPTPSLQYNTDKTRAKSEYNLLLSELRDFLLALYYNEQQIQKNFEVKNRAYIRYVISVHISDLDEGLTSTFSLDNVNIVKISRQVDSISFLPQKLLTIPFENCSEEELLLNPAVDSNQLHFTAKNEPNTNDPLNDLSYETKEHLWKQLIGYVATPAHLRLWNFPLPLEVEQPAGKRQKIDEDEQTLTQEEFQREESFTTVPTMSMDVNDSNSTPLDSFSVATTGSSSSITQIGINLLPSITEVETIQSSSLFQQYFPFQSVEFYQDFPKNENSHILSHFIQSIDYSSAAYDALYTSSSSSSSSTKVLPLMIAAIDCEMCETSKGLEVTRVTILDHDSKVIVDLLVKPDHPIIDYRTNYSGITEAILQPITTKLIQIQILLLRLICSQTILIGHSLENDLKVLHFIHFKIIDTTLLYPHPQGFPYRSKLRYLAKEYLQLSIQQSTGSSSSTSSTMTKKEMKEQAFQAKGHDSQEDASAAMKLVLLKMNKGPLFGLPSSIESESLRVPITKRLSYLKIPSLLIDYHPINSTNNNHVKDVDNKQEAASQSVLNQENHFLENLVCQGSTMVKSHSLEDILAKIEKFVISQQKQQQQSSSSSSSFSSSTVQEPEQEQPQSEQLGKGKKRSLDEEDTTNNNNDEDNAAIHELSSINQKNYDQPHFIHVTIPFQMDKKQEIQQFFQQLQTRLKPSLPSSTDNNSIINTHGLLMITSQRPLQQIQQLLSKREKIFSNQKRMTSMIWTSEDEEKLKYLIKENSLGNVSFHIL